MFTKLEQHSCIRIEIARGFNTQECFQGLHEACGDAALPYCKVAQWVRAFQEGSDAFRTISVQDDPTWKTTLLASLMDCMWVSRGSLSMSQNWAPHSAWHSELSQTCSTLDIPWNFRAATIVPLCSRTGLVGPVPKGRWWLSWANCRYGQNLGLLIWTNLETPIKWTEASWFSLSKESAPYTMCCEGDVHSGMSLMG